MLYSIGKFAKEIGVTTTTLRNWDKSGELKPFKITKGGKTTLCCLLHRSY